MNTLEILATLCTIICVIYTYKENVMCWPSGILSCIFLAIVYTHSNLYAQVVLQGISLIQCVLGWYYWTKKNGSIPTIHIQKLYNKLVLKQLSVAIVCGIVYAWGSATLIPYLDGISAFIALLGTWYFVKKVIQGWFIYMLVNLILVVLLYMQGLYLLVGLNVLLFVFSLIGYIKWQRNIGLV